MKDKDKILEYRANYNKETIISLNSKLVSICNKSYNVS